MRNISTHSAFPPMFLNPFADVLLALYAYYSTDVVTFAGKEIKSLSTDNDTVYPVYGIVRVEEAAMNNPEITLRCMNGFTLHVIGSNLVVESKRKEETFPLSKIQSFSLKEPRLLNPGTISFHTAQAASFGVSLGGIGAALGAEQSFFFLKADLETALQVRDYISNYSEDAKSATSGEKKVVSVVEEIRGLKELLDDGILTQEEFDAKKKQLLGI